MVMQVELPAIDMAGSPAQKALAKRLLVLLRVQGRFMSADSPIRLPVDAVLEALASDGKAVSAADVRAAIKANSAVFIAESVDDRDMIVTTKLGRAPIPQDDGRRHDFRERFMTPLPKQAPAPARDRPILDPVWADLVGGDLSSDGFFGEQAMPAAIIVDRPVLPPIHSGPDSMMSSDEDEIVPPALDDQPFTLTDRAPVEDETSVDRDVEAEAEPRVEPIIVEDEVEAVAVLEDDERDDLVAETAPAFDELADAMIAPPVEDDPVIEVPEVLVEIVTEADVPEELAPEPEPAPEPQPAPRAPAMPSFTTSDVSGFEDDALAATIADRLRADVRVANFSNQWMIEDRVPRFSRGDLRRLKEYVQEQEQPLTDDVLVQDVLSVRPNSVDFDLTRFAVNFRLSREHRDFDFVGTNDQRFWSTSSLPQIGTTRRKPNELGTDYRYLLEETPETPPYRTSDSVLHVVTFFEYYHGLIPYNTELQALLPGPLLEDQRTAMLTFETPQSYTTFLVELRFPTPNRGGFILGLDDFYSENLVPGAMISIQQTENDGHYRVEYLPAANQEVSLLELDERRAQRYVFRSTTYACDVDDGMLLSEERFPNMANGKPLEDKIRRRPELVVANLFERVGVRTDGVGYTAPFTDLFAAVNVERPFSEALLRRVLETDETGAFAKDPDADDAYTYVPSNPA